MTDVNVDPWFLFSSFFLPFFFFKKRILPFLEKYTIFDRFMSPQTVHMDPKPFISLAMSLIGGGHLIIYFLGEF